MILNSISAPAVAHASPEKLEGHFHSENFEEGRLTPTRTRFTTPIMSLFHMDVWRN